MHLWFASEVCHFRSGDGVIQLSRIDNHVHQISIWCWMILHLFAFLFSFYIYIHYGKPVIRCVPKSSPCANHWAHGEESLCRGPNTEHTAKIKHTAKGGFAVCPNLSTRPTDFFAVCHRPAHGKDSATWPDVHGWSTPSYFAVCLR